MAGVFKEIPLFPLLGADWEKVESETPGGADPHFGIIAVRPVGSPLAAAGFRAGFFESTALSPPFGRALTVCALCTERNLRRF